jgi:HEAT repeat protein
MRKRRWVALGLLVAVGAGGAYVYRTFRGASEVAGDYEVRTFLPEELEEALRSEDPARRADAASQVETMPPERRREVLIALVGDERAHVRLMAVTLLGRLHAGEDGAIAALADVLSLDVDLDVRSAAVAALAESENPRALEALAGVLMDDPSLVVKREAAEALDRLTGQSFGKVLVERIDAAESFGKVLVERIDAAEEACYEANEAYEEWLEERVDELVWDPARGRFAARD